MLRGIAASTVRAGLAGEFPAQVGIDDRNPQKKNRAAIFRLAFTLAARSLVGEAHLTAPARHRKSLRVDCG